ncbi:DNA topoisomerase III alpha, partial [Pseudoloma neurophilia]
NNCQFFKWKGIQNLVDQHGPSEIKCQCGDITRKMVSNTEKNKARAFYKCNRRYKPCNFFLWAD